MDHLAAKEEKVENGAIFLVFCGSSVKNGLVFRLYQPLALLMCLWNASFRCCLASKWCHSRKKGFSWGKGEEWAESWAKEKRRRQLGFSVVYPIKSYLISNALTQAVVSRIRKAKTSVSHSIEPKFLLFANNAKEKHCKISLTFFWDVSLFAVVTRLNCVQKNYSKCIP